MTALPACWRLPRSIACHTDGIRGGSTVGRGQRGPPASEGGPLATRESALHVPRCAAAVSRFALMRHATMPNISQKTMITGCVSSSEAKNDWM